MRNGSNGTKKQTLESEIARAVGAGRAAHGVGNAQPLRSLLLKARHRAAQNKLPAVENLAQRIE